MAKGFYFSMDAFLAASLLVLGMLLLSAVYVKDKPLPTSSFSQDSLALLSTIKVGEINNPYINALIANGTIKNSNISVIEQIGALWAENKTGYARLMIINLTGDLIPQNYGFAIYADGELIYTNNKSVSGNLVSTKAIVSGITKDKPFKGFSSRLILTDVSARTTSHYVYFGGFVGQGNITQKFTLPSKISLVKEAYLELDPSNNFTLLINNANAGTYKKGSAGGGSKMADKWALTLSNLSAFKNGTNTLEIRWNGSGYVGGGFLRVTFTTEELNDSEIIYFQNQNSANKKELLPGIKGVINLYSSFFVPGNITSMSVKLHFSSDYPAFMNVGNATIFTLLGTGETTAYLDNVQLASKLNYTQISDRTVPFRIGSGEGNQTILGSGNADIVLVNDASGSMEWCTGTFCQTAIKPPTNYCGVNNNYRPENGTYCNWYTENYSLPNGSSVCSGRWHGTCTSNDTRKVDVAKNASKQFATTVLGTAGNKLGLVEYSSAWNQVIHQGETQWSKRFAPFPNSIVGRENLTQNSTKLVNHLDQYYDSYWATCACCGVREAKNMLTNLSNITRKRVIVVMSDGEINDKCTGAGQGSAQQDAIDEAQAACILHNITVYTVGFGVDADYDTLSEMAACNGSYYNASNFSQLIDIYKSIANQLVSISYTDQQINVSGGGNLNSTLFDDSYIEFNYTPTVSSQFNKIPVTLETARFGNNVSIGSLDIPQNATVVSVRVTSFSGDDWTHNLTVKNSAENTVFLLSFYSNNYTGLGDPFVVDAPASSIAQGANTLAISAGVNRTNTTGGSADDRAIYTINIDTSTSYTPALSSATGCSWKLSFQDGTNQTINIPSSYTGAKVCFFQNGTYDSNDALDLSAYNLFAKLDLDSDGFLNVILTQQDMSITTATVTEVPSLWGPAAIEARIWQ